MLADLRRVEGQGRLIAVKFAPGDEEIHQFSGGHVVRRAGVKPRGCAELIADFAHQLGLGECAFGVGDQVHDFVSVNAFHIFGGEPDRYARDWVRTNHIFRMKKIPQGRA